MAGVQEGDGGDAKDLARLIVVLMWRYEIVDRGSLVRTRKGLRSAFCLTLKPPIYTVVQQIIRYLDANFAVFGPWRAWTTLADNSTCLTGCQAGAIYLIQDDWIIGTKSASIDPSGRLGRPRSSGQ